MKENLSNWTHCFQRQIHIEQAVANGELKIILEDYDQPELGVYAVFPHRQYMTAKVRAFVDLLAKKLRDDPALQT